MRRARGVKLSIAAKVGLAVAVVPTVLFPSIQAIRALLAPPPLPGGKQPEFFSSLSYAGATFLDEISNGYGFGKPFGSVQMQATDGTFATVNTVQLSPPGALIKLTGLGTGIVIADAVRSIILNFAARRGHRAARVAGMTMTTGR